MSIKMESGPITCWNACSHCGKIKKCHEIESGPDLGSLREGRVNVIVTSRDNPVGGCDTRREGISSRVYMANLLIIFVEV